jgi:hypothetical protein
LELDYGEMVMLDAEELAEGGIKGAYEERMDPTRPLMRAIMP